MTARSFQSNNIINVAVDAIERQAEAARAQGEIRSLRLDLDIERDARADDVRANAQLNRAITALQDDLKNSRREVIARGDLLAKVGKEWGEPHHDCPNLNSDVCYEPNCFDGHLVEVKS